MAAFYTLGTYLVKGRQLFPYQVCDLFLDALPHEISGQVRAILHRSLLPFDLAYPDTFRALKMAGKQVLGHTKFESEEDVACSMRRDGIAEIEDEIEVNLTYFPINMETPPYRRRSDSQAPIPRTEDVEEIAMPVDRVVTPGESDGPVAEELTEARYPDLTRVDGGDGQVPGLVDAMVPDLEALKITGGDSPFRNATVDAFSRYPARGSPSYEVSSSEDRQGSLSVPLEYTQKESTPSVDHAAGSHQASGSANVPASAGSHDSYPLNEQMQACLVRHRNTVRRIVRNMGPEGQHAMREWEDASHGNTGPGESWASALTDKDVRELCHQQ
jgi:hypothetical protein